MDLFLLCGFGYDSNHPDWNSQCLLTIPSDANCCALRRPAENQPSPLWRRIPTMISSRQDAAPTEKHTTSAGVFADL
jgi:hypothetical protein